MVLTVVHPAIAVLIVSLLTVAREHVREYEVLRCVGALLTMMWYHSMILTFKPHKAYRQVNLVASMLTASLSVLMLSGVAISSPLSGCFFRFLQHSLTKTLVHLKLALC